MRVWVDAHLVSLEQLAKTYSCSIRMFFFSSETSLSSFFVFFFGGGATNRGWGAADTTITVLAGALAGDADRLHRRQVQGRGGAVGGYGKLDRGSFDTHAHGELAGRPKSERDAVIPPAREGFRRPLPRIEEREREKGDGRGVLLVSGMLLRAQT